MSAKYFYTVKGVRQGPVTLDELKLLAAQQELRRSDQLWTEGMAAWQRAGLTPAIFEGLPPDLDPVVETITPPPTTHNGSNIMTVYVQVLKNYAVFDGRARRREYWTFFFANLAVLLVLSFIEGIFGGPGVMATLYNLAVMIPTIAVGVRRMHDTDRSGWWLLLPIANIVFLAEDSKPGSNRFGPNPKTATP
jgi:uncharacterized membrane protein YhaH (DUF805 family)